MAAKEAAGEVTLGQEGVNDHSHPRHNGSRSHTGSAGPAIPKYVNIAGRTLTLMAAMYVRLIHGLVLIFRMDQFMCCHKVGEGWHKT